MTREEWMQRYAACFKAAGFDDEGAQACAVAAAEALAEEHPPPIPWHEHNPEDEAAEEMSYWTDDEGGEG